MLCIVNMIVMLSSVPLFTRWLTCNVNVNIALSQKKVFLTMERIIPTWALLLLMTMST